MKPHRLLTILFLFATGILYSQTNFKPGYIITSNNDTVKGEIDYRGDELMAETCRFRLHETAEEIKYSPNDIVAYRFNDNKYFIAKELNGKKVFLEFLIKGKINMYYVRDKNGDHYFIEKAGTAIVEIPYETGIKYIDEAPYFYTSTKHIGLLNYYMQDAPELLPRIAQFGKPEHDNLIKLAKDYHTLMCKDTACIIFEKPLPLLQIKLEFVNGAINFTDNVDSKIQLQCGVLMHLWLPRTNENLYLRIGQLFTLFKTKDGEFILNKIPVQVEYMYPKGNVRPVFAYGVNFLNFSYQSTAFMAGVNINLQKSIALGLYYDIDFNPNKFCSFFPQSFLSQSVLVGFQVKL